MRLATLLGPDLKALIADPEALAEAFEDFHAEDVAELLEDLPEADVVELLEALPSGLAADVVERLSTERQLEVLDGFQRETAAELLTEMDPDDRADFFEELDKHEAKAYFETLHPEVVEETLELLGYDPETAGGLMTTDYVGLAPDTKVWEAIDEVRELSRTGDAETVYAIYVIAFGAKLQGVVSLRDLILSDPGQTLADIMTEKVVRVEAQDDQEEVARVIARYDLTVVPVVDEHEVLVGVVTIDDMVDVVIEEATEDAQMMGGVVPLEDAYFSTGLIEFIWKRGVWLMVLFLGQLLTATVMEHNQAALLATVELAIFIPLIISSGGNAGSQSSTLIIRAMAVGEAKPRDWARVLSREVVIGLALGTTLGAMGFARAYFNGGDAEAMRLAGAVSLSIVAIVLMSTVVGSLLPMLIRRVGLDPAVSSTPFIASVVDVLGLLVYFSVAHVILHAAF
jgi:magnesium transporter